MQNPTGTACAAAPRSLQTLARAGSRRAASGRFLITLGQNFSSWRERVPVAPHFLLPGDIETTAGAVVVRARRRCWAARCAPRAAPAAEGAPPRRGARGVGAAAAVCGGRGGVSGARGARAAARALAAAGAAAAARSARRSRSRGSLRCVACGRESQIAAQPVGGAERQGKAARGAAQRKSARRPSSLCCRARAGARAAMRPRRAQHAAAPWAGHAPPFGGACEFLARAALRSARGAAQHAARTCEASALLARALWAAFGRAARPGVPRAPVN